MSQTDPNQVSSIFDRAWAHIGPHGTDSIPLTQTTDLIRLIEHELMGTDKSNGFLYKDELIQIDTNRIIRDLELELLHPKDKINVPKLYMFHIVSEVLSKLKIFDYDTMKWYGNIDSSDHHPLTKKESIDSFMVIDSTDDEFDFDETSSLMQTGTATFESPSSHITQSPVNDAHKKKSSRTQIFELKKSLQDLQTFHSTLDNKFQAFEMEIQQLQDQNNHDFENLQNLNKQQVQMSSRVGNIRSELMTCSIQLHDIAPGITPLSFVTSYIPTQPALTETQLLDLDLQIIDKLTLKPKTLDYNEQQEAPQIIEEVETLNITVNIPIVPDSTRETVNPFMFLILAIFIIFLAFLLH